jgi:hypothetical protein
MEKYWTIVFPGEYGQHVQETWSEPQILKSYYGYWCERMVSAGKNLENYTEQDCIEDWCIVHWAEQTDSLGNKL